MKLSKAERQLQPTSETTLDYLNQDEKHCIENVVKRAEAEDKQDDMRIKYMNLTYV